MSEPRLNTLNFIPSKIQCQNKFSVVFWYSGVYRERRFETKEEAEKFADTWRKYYSEEKWSHRPISEWVSVTESPLYINERTLETVGCSCETPEEEEEREPEDVGLWKLQFQKFWKQCKMFKLWSSSRNDTKS